MDGERGGVVCVKGERYLMRADGEKKTERTEHLEKQEFGSPNFAKKKERNKKK